MAQIIYSPSAEKDLIAITEYLASEANADTARRVSHEIIETISRLERHPYSGFPRPHLGPGTRGVLCSPYIAYYETDGQIVTILRIVHTARHITKAILSRDDL